MARVTGRVDPVDGMRRPASDAEYCEVYPGSMKKIVGLALFLILSGTGCMSTSGAEVRVVLAEGEAPEFAADASSILDELEAWRGLPFLEDLRVEILPASEVSDKKLNGWYEWSTKRLVVVEGKSTAMGRGVLLHEMFHALQDQHFNLWRHHAEVAPLGLDAQRALGALIEGEAMLAVSEILDYDFERHAHLPEEGAIDAERFEKLFHYGSGLRFVRALRAAGGWEAVDAAYADPPRTTAKIYHPERYLDPEPPLDTAAIPSEGAVDLAAPRGEFELHLFLARSETLRPRVAELAAHVVSDLAWSTGDETVWQLKFDDLDAVNDIVQAADSLGAHLVVTVTPSGGMITCTLED